MKTASALAVIPFHEEFPPRDESLVLLVEKKRSLIWRTYRNGNAKVTQGLDCIPIGTWHFKNDLKMARMRNGWWLGSDDANRVFGLRADEYVTFLSGFVEGIDRSVPLQMIRGNVPFALELEKRLDRKVVLI